MAQPPDRNLELAVMAAALIAIVVTPIALGPWLPLVDLAAFVGLNSYPPGESYGPFHYYIFQLTYIGHYALSRVLYHLGLSVAGQIVAIYLLQVVTVFAVVVTLLRQLVDNVWARAFGVSLGCLAGWDGLFLWGGPLAFSLSGVLLAVASCLTVRQFRPGVPPSDLAVGVLCFLALLCHPFSLPFSLLLAGLRICFLPQRGRGLLLGAALLVGGFIVMRDSPPAERETASRLSTLFAVSPGEMLARVTGLFSRDPECALHLFGFVPGALRIYFAVLGVTHLAGFLLSPLLVWKSRERPALRFLAALNLAVGLMYFFSTDRPENAVPQWPQRILTFHSAITFVGGFAGLVWLVRSTPLLHAVMRRTPLVVRTAAVAGILVMTVAAQAPILRLGEDVRRNLDAIRSGLVASGLRNAFVVVSDVNSIEPFYLRILPFLLFSDPALVERNLLFFTEWHHQPRHPTRIPESWFGLGRARFLARFSSREGAVHLQLDPQPGDSFPTPENTNTAGFGSAESLAWIQFHQGVALSSKGAMRDAAGHFQAAVKLKPDWPDAHNNLGASLMNSGRPREAVVPLREAVKLAPGSDDGQLNLITALLLAGERDEAESRLKDYLARNPDSARARDLVRRFGLQPPG